jgi:hypothetical protein
VFIVIFILCVVDTHRHRKKELKKRHKTKHDNLGSRSVQKILKGIREREVDPTNWTTS